MLATQKTPAMGQATMEFSHTDMIISVQYPAGSPGQGSPRRRREDPLSRAELWGSYGSLVHAEQAALLQESRGVLGEVIKDKNAEVQQAGAHKAAPKKGTTLAPVRPPVLNLDAALTMTRGKSKAKAKSMTARTLRRHGQGYDELLNSPDGPFSPAALRGAVTDREMRHRWLASTEHFSRASRLQPFAKSAREATPVTILKREEIPEQEEKVRAESQRISDLLHGVNVNLMKATATSKDPGSQNRRNMLDDIRQGMRRQRSKLKGIILSQARLDGCQTVEKPPDRYNFLKANAHDTAQLQMRSRGARIIRNSVQWTDKADSALYAKAEKLFATAETVRNDVIRRELRAEERAKGEEQKGIELAQQKWLASIILARLNLQLFRPILISTHIRREHAAKAVQRWWMHARMKSLVKKTRAKRLIAKWWQDHKEPIRAAMYSREVEKIKTFYEETKNQEAVMPKIRRFKRAVLRLQREMRGVLHRCEKTRKRLLAQYDKVEKKTLVELVRERIKSIDDAAKAAAASEDQGGPKVSRKRTLGGKLDEDPINWDQIYESGDYSKLKTPMDVKLSVIHDLMVHQREVFHVARLEHVRAMKEFKASFRAITLFRTQVQDFLAAIEQEHRLDDVESLAGQQSDLVKALNKSLPQLPKFTDVVGDAGMRDTVLKGLHLAAATQVHIKFLLTRVVTPADQAPNAARTATKSNSKLQSEKPAS